jgi:hypothetical protein
VTVRRRSGGAERIAGVDAATSSTASRAIKRAFLNVRRDGGPKQLARDGAREITDSANLYNRLLYKRKRAIYACIRIYTEGHELKYMGR